MLKQLKFISMSIVVHVTMHGHIAMAKHAIKFELKQKMHHAINHLLVLTKRKSNHSNSISQQIMFSDPVTRKASNNKDMDTYGQILSKPKCTTPPIKFAYEATTTSKQENRNLIRLATS